MLNKVEQRTVIVMSSDKSSPNSALQEHPVFATTHWSVVLAALPCPRAPRGGVVSSASLNLPSILKLRRAPALWIE